MRIISQCFILIFLTIGPITGVYAQPETRIAGMFTWEWDERKTHLKEIHKDELSLRGLEAEFKKDYLGLGISSLFDFEKTEMDKWDFNWQGQFFIRYHLLGNSCLLDPFLEGAYGNYGTSGMDSVGETRLSLVPSAGAGLNLLLRDGFYLGTRLIYRADNDAVPGTVIPLSDVRRWQASITAGIRLGAEGNRSRRYYDRYFREY